MALISEIGLMLRSHVFNQTRATVALAERHCSDARFERALNAIENRQDRVASNYMKGRISLEQLYQKTARTVHRGWRLDQAVGGPDTDDRAPAACMKPVDFCSKFQTHLRRVHLHGGSMPGTDILHRLQRSLSVEQTERRERKQLADSFWAGELVDYATFKEQVTALAQREWTGKQGPGSAPPTTQQTALNVFGILHHLRQAEPRGPGQSWHPNITFFDKFSSKLERTFARKLEREAAAALLPDDAAGAMAVHNTERLPAPTSPVRPVPDHAEASVAEMQQALANAFWDACVRTCEELQGHIDSVARYATAHLPRRNPNRAQRVCEVTFETLEIIRQQQPTGLTHAWTQPRFCWPHFSSAIEQRAAERLLRSREQWNTGKSD